MDKIKVSQDDTITFNIKSDVLGDFHLHGYNHHAELEPGTTSQMKFTADATGNFVIMLHVFEASADRSDPEGEHQDEEVEGEHDEGTDSEEGEHQDEGSEIQEDEHEGEHTGEEAEVQIATLEVHPR